MPVLFVFLLKVNIALLLFCAGYYLVLRHLTFYTLNRVYLLAAILFASIYPEINLSAFVQGHEAIAKPVQQIAINWQGPVQNLLKPLSQPNYWRWAEVIFWLGAYIFALRLAVQLFSLYKLYKSSKPATINNHQVRIMDKDAAPFSFWQSIFVNPSKHEPAELKAILLHEQVHVNEWHTADILLAELSSIFYWFNPGIWLIKKAIRENIEFITDRKILNNGIDSKSYQYSLISVSFNNQQPGIVNHFNISTIKKRIIMMNTKRSSKSNLTRYAFLVPAVITLLLVFSISKADFAKPIRVKLVNAAAPLAKIISSNVYEKLPAKPVAVAKPKKVSRKVTKALPMAQKPDTIKKALVINKNMNNDSVIFIINGVKSDLKKIDADNVANAYVLCDDDAAPYISKSPDKNVKVVYMITKDAANKQELKDKLNKVNNNAENISSNAVTYTSTAATSAANTNGIAFTSAYNSINAVSVRIKPLVAVKVSDVKINNVSAKTVTGPKGAVVVKTYSITTPHNIIIGEGNPSSVSGMVSSNDIKVTNLDGVKITTDDGSDPVIVIDGKTSSSADLKKLKSTEINGISILKGDSAKKQYGDKAKDGVVVITTNKK
ncbi:MAG TPA: M56 family metallopeptidase [Mucilaginibacter sp.]|nr:M56 family metallopeptidase [Mucilaginibacter sp.]